MFNTLLHATSAYNNETTDGKIKHKIWNQTPCQLASKEAPLMVPWILMVLGPKIQGPDYPPLYTGPLHSVSKFLQCVLLGSHCCNLKTEEDLILVNTIDILVSKLGEVMGAMFMCATFLTF